MPLSPTDQASAFMEFFKDLPGFGKESYGRIERDILSCIYRYDAVDHVLIDQNGWLVRVESDGRFMPIGES
jgi:hypothetical protein